MPRPGLSQCELFLSLHERCAVRYRPRQSFPGPGIVVRRVDASETLREPRDFGWSRWVDGSVSVFEISGDHLDVLRAPMVTDLAARLRDAFATVS